jgi:hypothetical protein
MHAVVAVWVRALLHSVQAAVAYLDPACGRRA